jgi:hypothetical protein
MQALAEKVGGLGWLLRVRRLPRLVGVRGQARLPCACTPSPPSPPQPKLPTKARQSLGIGGAEFEPTSLERYHRALASADPAAAWLREYARLLDTFADDASGG